MRAAQYEWSASIKTKTSMAGNLITGMKDDLGRDIEDRVYNQRDMDRILVLNQGTKLVARWVMKLSGGTDPWAKTIIFCADIDHFRTDASAAIVHAAGKHRPGTCVNTSCFALSATVWNQKLQLDNGIDPESKFPVIATTSDLIDNRRGCKNLQAHRCWIREFYLSHDHIRTDYWTGHPYRG